MKKLFSSVGAAALALVSAGAEAAVYKFTAVSAGAGQLGFLKYDSSSFSTSSFQSVGNADLLEIYFEHPVSHFTVTTPGPVVDSTLFDGSGSLPIVIGGSGFTGGTTYADGVYIAYTNYIDLAGTVYEDVTWTTSIDTGALPEPATWGLMIAGFGLVGAAMRKRARSAVVGFGLA